MNEKTRKQQAKDRLKAEQIDPSEYGVRSLSPEEIAKLYPGTKVDRRAWTPEHRDFMARSNMNARKKSDSRKKELRSFEE